MHLKCNYSRDNLNVDFYPSFLNKELADTWFVYLLQYIPVMNRRNSVLFGDDGIIYTVNYIGETSSRPVLPWTTIPGLVELKTFIEAITKERITVCIIQCYPNGNIGINPHRDKEMIPGTKICGVSLGATRTLSFTRSGQEPINISLPSGSLYVMNPPTNDKWLHSIVKQPNKVSLNKNENIRFSLTFRSYKG